MSGSEGMAAYDIGCSLGRGMGENPCAGASHLPSDKALCPRNLSERFSLTCVAAFAPTLLSRDERLVVLQRADVNYMVYPRSFL